MKDHMSEEHTLWKSFLDGNISALEKIFKLYYKDLYGYGLKLSRCPELTKDSINELFVRLWDSRTNIDEPRSVKAYLLASLRRSLLKEMKKRRRYIIKDMKDRRDTKREIQFSPEELIINSEQASYKTNALYEALDSLPDRQKEVLYLRYFNGMSYTEIEDILSINYQSIRNHVYRALQRLRDTLADDISHIAVSIILFLLFI